MRIASTQYHATMNTALQMAQSRVEKVMQQMARGERVLRPSDDPIASVRLARLSREEAALDQYRDNIGALNVRLRKNEMLLNGMSGDLLQMRDLLVWAADGSNTADDLRAMAGSLEALRDSLYASANSRDQEGRYLFSGTATGSPTVTYDGAAAPGARYTFTGNGALQQVVVGSGVTQEANVPLSEMATFLNRLDLTIADLNTPGVSVNDPAVRATLTTTMQQVDVTLNSVGARIARLGGAQVTLDTLDTGHANVSLSNKQAVITLGQLDYGDAAVRLNGYTTALQATQKAYVKVSALSLFDVL